MLYFCVSCYTLLDNFGQLSLPLGQDDRCLRDYFSRAIGKAVSLVLTDNSSSMLSVKTRENHVTIRLHRMFLGAGDDVLGEVAEFIKRRKTRTPLVRQFVRQNTACLKRPVPRALTMKPEGRYYNLQALFEAINHDYFAGRLSCSITWGTRSPRYTVRKRTLGSYTSHSNTIRINPVLDSKKVPPYVVDFIVYHEMLHADMGIEKKNGRRSVHSKEFRERERLFRDYGKAMAWEKNTGVR